MKYDKNIYNYDDKEIGKKVYWIRDLLKTMLIMIFSILISIMFGKFGFNESNIILIFILGVIFTARSTEGYFYGTIASIIGVLAFNFFFTVPYYTFRAYRSDYPITFLVMLLVAIITSMLTSKVKREAKIAYIRERRIRLLYENNKRLLMARNKNQIIKLCGESLVDMCNRTVMIIIKDSKNNLIDPRIYGEERDGGDGNIFKSSLEKNILEEAFKLGRAVGIGTDYCSESSVYYYPIKGQHHVLGVICMNCFQKGELTSNEKITVAAISAQVALAIEREELFEKNEKVNLDAERERLRGNLLRSISHDLRTPLTSIMGSASTILENYDLLDKSIQKELLQNICEDTSWLIHSVENILSMTRVDEGKLEIEKEPEIIEEIITQAISRVRKFADNRNIKIDLPRDMVLISVDWVLIEQVFVNLIHNAIKYTPDNSEIKIKLEDIGSKVIFEVSDNGNGIPKEDLPNIFTRFYTKSKVKHIENRGIGLGLAICKSIIKAHNGEMEAFNNELGGATFRFSIPREEGGIYGDKTINFNCRR